MPGKLAGRKIAFFASPEGTEAVELTKPWEAIEQEGAAVELVSFKPGEIQLFNHLDKAKKFPVDKTLEQAKPDDYDGLVLPGGVANPDFARQHSEAVEFVRGFFEQNKPVAAICHAPWMLVEAGVVDGRTITSWPSLKTDIVNAGGNWVDQEVVVDNGLVTSRKPDDLPAFCAKAVEEFSEGRHTQRSA
jgi:protease I